MTWDNGDGVVYYEEGEHRALCAFVRWNPRHPSRTDCPAPAEHFIGSKDWAGFGICRHHWPEVQLAISLEVLQAPDSDHWLIQDVLTRAGRDYEALDSQRRADRAAATEAAIARLQQEGSQVGSAVYFVQMGDAGPIKIGTTREIRSRFEQLQTGSPYPLRLRALVAGDARLETAYHDRFAAHRLSGEWFEPDRALLDVIAGLASVEARNPSGMSRRRHADRVAAPSPPPHRVDP